MEHRISTLFYSRKSKKTSHGLAPVYLRITVNGQRLEQSIQRFVDPAQWSAAAGRLKGNSSQARQLNLYLDTLSSKVLQMERELVIDGITVNFSNFREKWLGLTEPVRLLLDVFQQHNDQMAALIRQGKNFVRQRWIATIPAGTMFANLLNGSTRWKILISGGWIMILSQIWNFG